MAVTPIRDLLAALPLFAELEPADLDLFAGCGRNEVFETGAVLAREDDAADRFYVVRHGRVALQMHAPGTVLTVDTAGPGEVIDWSWVVAPYRWTTDVVALEPTRAVAVDGRCLRDKCAAEPEFGYRVMRRFAQVMAHQLDTARLRLLDLYGSGHGR